MSAHFRVSSGGKKRKHTKYTKGERQHAPNIEFSRQGLGMAQGSEILRILHILHILIRQRWLEG